MTIRTDLHAVNVEKLASGDQLRDLFLAAGGTGCPAHLIAINPQHVPHVLRGTYRAVPR